MRSDWHVTQALRKGTGAGMPYPEHDAWARVVRYARHELPVERQPWQKAHRQNR